MSALDWLVICIYLIGIVLLAFLFNKKQQDLDSYYLADRETRWWQSGMSTMATQLGAISFVSAPAFVAIKEGGGLKWLAYEFGVPVGILIAAILILPALHRGRYISIYEYLEHRYDRSTRLLISFLFQLGRGLATAVSVLAGGLILSTVLPFTTAQAIVLIGFITILYDVIGGIRVVIVSDVLQMAVILFGVLVCGIAALDIVGWSGAWSALGAGRSQILDFSHPGLAQGQDYAFWPMAIGGIFLYASYYGCDQSQVQRELSVGRLADVRKSLMLNAFGRFPVVLLYCLMGVFVGAVFTTPEFLDQLANGLRSDVSTVATELHQNPDRMLPMFILAFLPAGLSGLIFVAIMSALMSSLDSAINSLSAVTVNDFYKRFVSPDASRHHYLVVSRILTVFWGVFCIIAALVFLGVAETTRQTTIVLINAVGSVLYGPILAAFLLGVTTRGIGGTGVKWGVVAGIVLNVALWQFTPVSWMWWNAAGFLVTAAVAIVIYGWKRIILENQPRSPVWDTRFALDVEVSGRRSVILVLFYTSLMIIISLLIENTI
jgi:SSS family transporter